MAGPFLAGVDVGTTSVKTALFNANGILLARRSSPIATQRPGPGLVEQAPEDWMSATLAGLETVLDGIPLDAVEGIGLCSQVNTHVFVDANGKALAPAIVWQDGRCAADAATLDRLVSEEARLKWWDAPLPIDSSHPLSRMAWMARVHPEIWRRARWVLAPKDYCLLALTGEARADPLSSFGVVDSSLRYIDELIALVPGAAERLPPLLGPAASAGQIRPGLPAAGRPIATATMDGWAGMLGVGAVRQGDAGYLSGTSEVVGIVSRRRLPTPGVIAFPDCEGITLHAARLSQAELRSPGSARFSAAAPKRYRRLRQTALLRGARRSFCRICKVNGRRSGTSRRAPRLPASTLRWAQANFRALSSRASPIPCAC